ncbi:WHG domain-containing protein [Streptomyces sp. B93]|uniref:WHG domain-containing protein n=1 Tax=Streptomyces sp. B93 TaxID=2824875 RepID=UPI001B38F609|nr:WHG domain-containing protein [Streptomyces sp. B93]MBQ1090055.1 WHG domain-containing protein [Streptomyces sp. B93]
MAYVRFAADERALFDLAFGAGLDHGEHPGLTEAGTALRDLLMPVTLRLTSDEAAAFELIVLTAAAAHGLAVFLCRAY